MRIRHKLALKYFLAAVLLFTTGYGAAWISGFFHNSDTDPVSKTSKPKVTPSTTETQPVAPNDKDKPSPKAGISYTVRSGDTLSSIASANGTTFDQLATYNNIPYPYNLTIGQVIVIPPQ